MSDSPPAFTMLGSPLAFVDLETTGTVAAEDRVTEVAVVRVEGGAIVEEWSSLVDPGVPIPPVIQSMTGITDAMVAGAPRFADLAAEVRRRLDGAIFVAHNARFDHGFLKHEFARVGERFRARVLCTARLSRRLFPEERRHNLDALVARHCLPAEARHRALGDARLLWHFVNALHARLPAALIEEAVDRILKVPSLPPHLPADALESLPEGPGVYLFYGLNALPLYIGKSVDLRDRVASHFSADYRTANDLRLSAEIRRIECRETVGELGALLLESRLIKALMPLHNQLHRRKAELCALHAGSASCAPRVVPGSGIDAEDASALYGPFANRRAAREALRALADEHGLCWKLLGLERRNGPCFARQVRKCAGACVGEEPPQAHHARLLAALAPRRIEAWPLRGPGVLMEAAPHASRVEVHVFDRWRWLGSAGSREAARILARRDPLPAFDLDVYRIVTGHLRRHPGVELALLPED
jgi:DNA polymerase-3 subunit epsilon